MTSLVYFNLTDRFFRVGFWSLNLNFLLSLKRSNSARLISIEIFVAFNFMKTFISFSNNLYLLIILIFDFVDLVLKKALMMPNVPRRNVGHYMSLALVMFYSRIFLKKLTSDNRKTYRYVEKILKKLTNKSIQEAPTDIWKPSRQRKGPPHIVNFWKG